MDPSFSPDGRWIAYETTDAARNPHIYLEPFPRTGERHLAAKEVGRNPFWSPSGTELVFSTGPGTFESVTVTTRPGVAFGNPGPVPRGGLTARAPDSRRNYDPAPDGKRILGVLDARQALAGSTPVIQVVLNWFEELKARVPTQ